MTSQTCYLDYNASAPLLASVKGAVQEWLNFYGNPSSIHHHGRMMRKKIEEVRKNILQGLNAPHHELYFTSGATEANRIVLHTFFTKRGRVLTLKTEHDSVLKNIQEPVFLSLDAQGRVDLHSLEEELKIFQGMPTLVSIMAANNETGVIQPLAEISSLCLKYSAFFHTDASQGLGRIPINLMDFHVDYVTLSAHKIGGLPGVGALIARKNSPLVPLYAGGGQEQGMRPGTYNTVGIMAFGQAFQEALAFNWRSVQELRDELEQTLQKSVPNIQIAGCHEKRIPNTTCVSMPDVPHEVQVIAFDLAGFSVSAGSACSSGKVKTSHVLKAMGIDEKKAQTFIRISLCPETTRQEIQDFIQAWIALYQHHHSRDLNL